MGLQSVVHALVRSQLAILRLVAVSMLEQWIGYLWLPSLSVLYVHQFDSATGRWLCHIVFAVVPVVEMSPFVGSAAKS